MVRTCCAISCKNRADSTKKNLSFHCFPTNPQRRSEWSRAVRRIDPRTKKDWQPSKHSALCSEHFLPHNFRLDRGYTILKSDAIPTVFNFPQQTSTKAVKQIMPSISSTGKFADEDLPKSLTSSVKNGHTQEHLQTNTANEHSYAVTVIESPHPFALKRRCEQAQRQLHLAVLSDLEKERQVISQLQQMLEDQRQSR